MYNEYRDRDLLVREIGYFSYTEYLNSDLWKSIRIRMYASTRGKCGICSSKANSIHHRQYTKEVLEGSDLTKLVPLCSKWHYDIEFNSNDTKRAMREVEVIFNIRLEEYRRKNKIVEQEVVILGKCKVCGKQAKKTMVYCKQHIPEEEKSKKEIKKPKTAKPGQRACQCGRRKRPGRKYCSWCWDVTTGRLRGT